MTTPDAPPPPPSKRRLPLVIGAILLIAVALFWWVSELYTTDAARACHDMYAGAKSAADTGRIDLIVPSSVRNLPGPHSCATYREQTPQ